MFAWIYRDGLNLDDGVEPAPLKAAAIYDTAKLATDGSFLHYGTCTICPVTRHAGVWVATTRAGSEALGQIHAILYHPTSERAT